MAMPNDYFILKAIDLSDLATQVVKHLNKGCELIGGISAYYHPEYNANGGASVYLQAMIDRTHNTKI
jgi:hypothetical protein